MQAVFYYCAYLILSPVGYTWHYSSLFTVAAVCAPLWRNSVASVREIPRDGRAHVIPLLPCYRYLSPSPSPLAQPGHIWQNALSLPLSLSLLHSPPVFLLLPPSTQQQLQNCSRHCFKVPKNYLPNLQKKNSMFRCFSHISYTHSTRNKAPKSNNLKHIFQQRNSCRR
uniref:Uncharacterized protein n=1 Tax=Ixodes ricinus TaxID=34613 RepID=A0A6B0UXJ3_IXORI